MRISLKVTICFMTASVSLLSVSGNKGGPADVDCDNTPVNQTALAGGSVIINCNYPRAEESNIRFFCKEDEKRNCINVISSRSSHHTKIDRFSLTDNRQQRVYTVTISRLTHADAGRYQCAMKGFTNTSTTCLTEVHLHILSWEDVEPMELSGDTGAIVQIKCSYPASHENKEKFLCKGENPFNCEELIHTTEQDRDMTKGRFTLKDNRRLKYFYVNIKNLSIDNSGTYWCSSERTRQLVVHRKIHLSVAEKHTKTKKAGAPAPQATAASVLRDKSPTTSSHPPNSSEMGMIVGVVVSLALLVIAGVVLILCRQKLPSTQGGSSKRRTNTGNDTEGNHGDHNYEEIQENLGNTLPSIYATINLPADQLHYSTVIFQEDSVSISTDRNTLPDTNQIGSSCDNSSISGTQGSTHPLYSTVNLEGNIA